MHYRRIRRGVPMKRIINWVKHEYRIAKDIDKPTYCDYCLVKLLFLPYVFLMDYFFIIFIFGLFMILPSIKNDFITNIILSFIFCIFTCLFILPIGSLIDKNSFYEL